MNKNLLFSIYLLIASSLFTHTLHATVQHADKLHMDGKEYDLPTFYVETFFDDYADFIKPQSAIKPTFMNRGYVAHVLLQDEKLFFSKILVFPNIVAFEQKEEPRFVNIIDSIFPVKEDRLCLISGLVVLPIDQHKRSYNEIENHRNYIVLELERGKILSKTEYSEAEFLVFTKTQLETFKDSKKYKDFLTKQKSGIDKFKYSDWYLDNHPFEFLFWWE